MDAADQGFLKQLLDEHGDALVLYAQQWCTAPEDVVQEAIIRLMRQRPVPDNVIGWLYRVIRNEAVSNARSLSRRKRHESAAGSIRVRWFKPTADDAMDAESAVAALECLPNELREVLVLRLWSGMSFEAIAEVAEVSTSTAFRRYESALRHLQERWKISCPNKQTLP